MFDLFGAHAMRPRLSSLADDAQQLRSDFEVVGEDISAVLAEQSRNAE